MVAPKKRPSKIRKKQVTRNTDRGKHKVRRWCGVLFARCDRYATDLFCSVFICCSVATQNDPRKDLPERERSAWRTFASREGSARNPQGSSRRSRSGRKISSITALETYTTPSSKGSLCDANNSSSFASEPKNVSAINLTVCIAAIVTSCFSHKDDLIPKCKLSQVFFGGKLN